MKAIINKKVEITSIEFTTKEEKLIFQDCIVYLLQHCKTFEKDNSQKKFCLDVAKKALFLYNLSPTSFGNKTERKEELKYIQSFINKYENNPEYHT